MSVLLLLNNNEQAQKWKIQKAEMQKKKKGAFVCDFIKDLH